MRNDIHLALQLLSANEQSEIEWPLDREWEWSLFAKTCEKHHLSAWIYHRLQSSGALSWTPTKLAERLRTRFYEVSAKNYRLAKELSELYRLLRKHGLPALAYKGPAVAMSVYKNLAVRQYSDIDLLVRPCDLPRALELFTAAGFERVPLYCLPQVVPYLTDPQNPNHLERAEEIPLRSPDHTYFVDLHWQLGDSYWRRFSPDVAKMWERAENIHLPQGQVSTFCREDLLLVLSFHGTKHRWWCLKWLVDFAEILRTSKTFDWSRVDEMVRLRPGARACLSIAAQLASDLFNTPVPMELATIAPSTRRTVTLSSNIRDEILDDHFIGTDFVTVLALEGRFSARVKCRLTRLARLPEGLFGQVFIQVDPKDRSLLSLPNKFQFLYHLIRPLRLLAKHGIRLCRVSRSPLRRLSNVPKPS